MHSNTIIYTDIVLGVGEGYSCWAWKRDVPGSVPDAVGNQEPWISSNPHCFGPPSSIKVAGASIQGWINMCLCFHTGLHRGGGWSVGYIGMLRYQTVNRHLYAFYSIGYIYYISKQSLRSIALFVAVPVCGNLHIQSSLDQIMHAYLG